MNYRIILLFTVLLVSTVDLSAKRYNPYGADWALGVHFGGTSFFGDINEGNAIKSTPFSKYFYQNASFMGGIVLDKWFGPYVGLTGSIQYGELQGTKAENNKWFQAKIFEYSLSGVANLSNLIFGINRRRNHTVYYSLGIGMSESRSWKYKADDVSGKYPIGTNGFGEPSSEGGDYIPMTETIVTTALGVKFYVGSNISVNLEGSIHAINSDKLDAHVYDNKTFLSRLEGYTYFSVGVQYHFGSDGRYATAHRHKSRYDSGRGGATEINMRKRNRAWRKIQKKKHKRFKYD